MYTLEARLKSNNVTTGYRIKDITTGEIRSVNKEQFKSLVAHNEVQGVCISNGRLSGKLRGIKEINSKTKNSLIEVYKDKECIDLIERETKLRGIIHKRSIFNKCEKLLSNNTKNLLILSGVRRMGKTILSFQLLNEMYQRGLKVAYVTILNEVPFSDLKDILDDLKDYEVICIDEVSRCFKFVNHSAFLYNYSQVNRRLILTGTDSFSFPLSLCDKLVGRAYVCNLTLLPYTDYVKIFGENFEAYQHLTSFMDSEVDFNVRMSFTENIYNSLKRSELTGTGYECLSDLKIEHLNFYVINALVQLISYMSSKFTTIKSSNIMQCAPKKKAELKHIAMKLMLDNMLKTDSSDFSFSTIQFQSVRKALVDLGVLLDIPFYNKRDFKTVFDKVMFVCSEDCNDKLTGFKFTFIEQMFCVKVFGLYSVLLDYYIKILNTICEQSGYKLDTENNSGELLENIIRANLCEALDENYIIAFYRANSGEEVDIIVYNRNTKYVNLYEVKHSTKQELRFFKHIDKPQVFRDICKFIGGSGNGDIKDMKLGTAAVIYRGITDGRYINVEDFLLDMYKYIK